MNGLAIGSALIAVALGIVLWQGRARSCARHSRLAGDLAWMLAALAFGAGVWLVSAE